MVNAEIRVRIPDNNVPERRYAVEMLFCELLGVACSIEVGDVKNYEISAGNGCITVRDGFFNHYPEPLSYLTMDARPKSVVFAPVAMAPDKDLPIIYGRGEISGNFMHLTTSIDIFASAFYMLSRWEVCVSEKRDTHKRLETGEHLSVLHGFSQRPVVNEYAELLGEMLCHVGFDRERRASPHELILTHDVDRLYRGPLAESIRKCLRFKDSKRFLIDSFYRAARIDVFGTFRRIMQHSESHGLKSHFYFIAGGLSAKEGYYELAQREVVELIREIRNRGHVLGFQPSYQTYRNPDQWNREREALQDAIGCEVREGRQHYLRFENPKTWRIWDDAGMEMDSTMGFADRVGFTCGTGNSFPVFDVLARRQLNLREQPLLVMDSALMKMNAPQEELTNIIEACNQYYMPLTILFHNHTLDRTPWNHLDETYQRLLSEYGGH
jgi:hypothetical protein